MKSPGSSPFSVIGRLRSFGPAVRGIGTLLRTQHNAWLHLLATVAVVGGGLGLRLSRVDWALIAAAIALVWLAEALNTAVEFLADEVSEEWRDRIGRAKDVAAAGVLVSAVAALVIGTLVFWPYVAHRGGN